jgi:Ca-activated chloride channel family protein
MKTIRFFWLTVSVVALSIFVVFSTSNPVDAQTDVSKPTPSPTVTPVAIGTPPPLTLESNDEIVIDTELVNLNVRVVDRFNRPVGDLSEKDFVIYEDRIVQPIKFFSTSDVPTNYTLVIDNSGSMRPLIEKVIDAGKTIINTNRPDDETSIIRFVSSEKIHLEQDFTSDKQDLMDALDELYIEGGQTAVIDAVYLAADRVNEYEKVRNDTKRRALVLVSDGENRHSVYDEKQLFQLLRETNVQIYAVGFIEDLDKDGSVIRDSSYKKSKKFLTRLAEETGGKVYFPSSINDLDGIAVDIAKELRTQYSIGYIPTNDKNDGTFRDIKVIVKDGENKRKRIAITKTGRIAEKETLKVPARTRSN